MANSSQDGNYYPVQIARSDGKGYPNLDHNPIDPNEVKDVEQLERWEVIIAHHLQFQLAPKDEKRQFKLGGFPRGYELRCAHRGGGQRDYYLYGHPAGPKSNYRTPGDFVLHLLWLASSSTDYAQCSCDLCVKMVEAHRQRAPQAQVPLPTALPAAGGQLAGQAAPPAPTPAPGSTPANRPLAGPAPPAPTANAPTGFPGMIGPSNVFRVGELVWYKQQAWRLGLVLAIRLKPGQPAKADNSYDYVLAPLGHAILAQPNVTKDATDMRPFLTFSVPDTAIPELQEKSFDSLDWQDIAARYSNYPGDQNKRLMKLQVLGLEASKIAARSINDSLSTFNRLGEVITADQLYKVQTFTGVYLGAEMIRLHDPIRVTAPAVNNSQNAGDAPKPTTAVMLVSEIQLLTPTWSVNDASSAAAATSLQFRGNIYRTVRALVPHPPNFVNPLSLGPAFEHEIAGRNQIERDKKFAWGWMLIESNAVRAEADVQGRFYVTHLLMSIMDPARLQGAVETGVIEEAQAYLNNRSHGSWGGRSIGLRPNRAASVGNAVATRFVAPQGLVEDQAPGPSTMEQHQAFA
ncbi:transcription-silencing protein Clr2-domain-containing protein [Cercophora newfieldiana]|uniref:Transcription-silencing protein Clr2-domain-containing protein n=1 Tax=Cercophora newfieldiana TaxID=92897 RepID=A0AA39Y525_9PEZI|nr:transcription-silencing protein Clr2-domain-containing protein [Cercophora newfieldiana]